jgi:hypothetical protein
VHVHGRSLKKKVGHRLFSTEIHNILHEMLQVSDNKILTAKFSTYAKNQVSKQNLQKPYLAYFDPKLNRVSLKAYILQSQYLNFEHQQSKMKSLPHYSH